MKHVIKNLKKKKSRDPYGYSNELFQYGGSDFQLAITKFMNLIKKLQTFLKMLELCNITSLYKNKGSIRYLNNLLS